MTTVKMHLIQRFSILLLLVVSLVLLPAVSSTKASHQLRSVVEKDLDQRELQQAQILPPRNDDCPGAMIIPSDFPGDTYTTKGVSIDTATNSTGPPYHKCYIAGRTKDVWYKFKPLATNVYGFSTNLGDTQMAIFVNRYTATCQKNTYRMDCQVARPFMDQRLFANETYFLFVQPAWANVTGSLQLTVQRRRPPSNNQCTNATVINPIGKTFLTIDDNKYAIYDPKGANFPYFAECSTVFDDEPRDLLTFWYKIFNPLTTPLSVDVAVDAPTFNLVTNIGIIEATNCSSLRCIGGLKHPFGVYGTVFYDFIAKPRTSYYILLKIFSSGPFNVTINGQPDYFSVIDSKSDKAIELLRDTIDYFLIDSGLLNVQARFTTSPESIKSVRLTYDNPKRNVCDQKAPYSVFGDSNGDYNNATIPLGQHRVTATPYAQPNCTGKAGTTIAQDFRVTGCSTYYVIGFDAAGQYAVFRPFTSEHISSRLNEKHTKLPVMISLKCKVSLSAEGSCGFHFQSMQTELRNAINGELIASKEFSGGRAFSFFGRVISNRHLPAGSYSLRTVINNVRHPAMNFTVVNTTCD